MGLLHTSSQHTLAIQAHACAQRLIIQRKIKIENLFFRQRIYAYALGLFACLLAQTNPLHAQMSTPGSGEVGTSGAFSYSIPIRIPPGTAGVQPSLALTYSSQAGNGIAGVGWNLSGLSVIMRCPPTFATDGVRGGVNMDDKDKLCLDGQRLILQSGTYGVTGSMYYTEIFNGSRIYQVGGQLSAYPEKNTTRYLMKYSSTSSGISSADKGSTATAKPSAPTAAGTPQVQFRVLTKAGEVMEYAPSEVLSGKATRMWLLLRVVDVKGNYWTVDYDIDTPNGEFVPTAVNYTANDTSGAVLAPYNKVVFDYEDRLDKNVAYVGSAKLSNTKRLKKIRVQYSPVGSTTLTDLTEYRLEYTPALSNATKRSLLQSVQEFACDIPASATNKSCTGSAPGGTWVSMNPIKFDYSNDALTGFTGVGTGRWNGSEVVAANTISGDFDGDGRSDLAAFDTSLKKWHVCLSRASNFECPTKASDYWSGPGVNVNDVKSGDFNGDGLTDLAAFDTNIRQWHVCLSTAKNFSCAHVNAVGVVASETIAADMDGDGRTDLAAFDTSKKQWHVCLSTGNSFACPTPYWTGPGVALNDVVASDVNGDGRTDFSAYDINRREWHVCKSISTDFKCEYWANGLGVVAEWVMTGDFNGDGKSDFAAYDTNISQWHTCLSTGMAFVCQHLPALGVTVKAAKTGDFNGDGMTDMAAFNTTLRQWHVCKQPYYFDRHHIRLHILARGRRNRRINRCC
jgi:hypothetical protein